MISKLIAKTHYTFLLILCLLLISSCTKSNSLDNLEDITQGTDFTAKVNGTSFGVKKDFARAQINRTQGFYVITIVAVDVTSTVDAKGIGLAMIGTDFNQLKAGIIFNTPEDGNVGASYGESDLINDVNDFETDDFKTVYIKITGIDKNKKIISAEFNFTVKDDDGNIATITDGKFNNLPYELIEN